MESVPQSEPEYTFENGPTPAETILGKGWFVYFRVYGPEQGSVRWSVEAKGLRTGQMRNARNQLRMWP